MSVLWNLHRFSSGRVKRDAFKKGIGECDRKKKSSVGDSTRRSPGLMVSKMAASGTNKTEKLLGQPRNAPITANAVS